MKLKSKSHFYNQKGFTLVELAIALMVIGLLIGGVLKGQELIENARVTSTIRDLKDYDSATMIFRNTYGALPGDFRRPNRIPGCTEALCNVAGNGNGRIGDIENETYNFFPHLTKAGLLKGPEGGTVSQKEALAPFMGTGGLEDADMPLEMLSLPNDEFLLLAVFDDAASPETLEGITPSSGMVNSDASQIRGGLGGLGNIDRNGNGLRIGDDMDGGLLASYPTDSPEYETFFPFLPIDGVGVNVMASATNNHDYYLRPVPVRLADQIDSKMDDGYANSGHITNGAAMNVLAQADGSDPMGLQVSEKETYDPSGRGGTTSLYFKTAY